MPVGYRFLFLVALLLIFVGCRSPGSEGAPSLTIFAAASLTDAFTELAQAFEERHPGVQVRINFGGSSQLAAQLREGAVADVFASANPVQMTAVVAAGRIAPGAEQPFASNRLTLIVPADNPAAIMALPDLAKPGVALLLAVPGVPVRAYTDEIMSTLDDEVQRQIYANVVSEEDNVRQVAAKVALGEADAGIVYTSDVTLDIATLVREIPLPAGQNVIANYPIAPLEDAPHPELARAFVAFVGGEAGQAVLARWGFGPPPGK